MRRKVRLALESEAGKVEVVVSTSADGRSFVVDTAGRKTAMDVAELPDGRLSVLFEDGRQICGRVLPRDGGFVVATRRGSSRVPIVDPIRQRLAVLDDEAEGGGEEVRALMPGRVLEVSVEPGDRVAAGAVLLVLEAMKMQNEIRASRPGVVARVVVEAGQAVDGGTLMILLQGSEEASK